jgi:dTDP-4-dehydrorhamnose 3,5-epimerase
MRAQSLGIADVFEIHPARNGDARGYFSEIYRDDWFAANIAPVSFVQENQSLSKLAGTVRGLHFQTQPFGQGKLVRCLAGAIFDVAVDIRHGSPSFGQWASATLSSEAGNQLWVPEGFLHGFCTLMPDTVVCYKVTAYYSREADKGVAWNDREIGIRWPELANEELLSAKDRNQPRLADLPTYFQFEAR